jgi:hypothetical protein
MNIRLIKTQYLVIALTLCMQVLVISALYIDNAIKAEQRSRGAASREPRQRLLWSEFLSSVSDVQFVVCLECQKIVLNICVTR